MNPKEFKQRPLIGVVSSHGDGIFKINQRYLHSLWKAGGLGVVLEYTEDPEMLAEYAAIFDGFLFSGGVDVNPTHYGEEKQFDSVEIDDCRDGFEKALFETVYPTGKPIFGICRGIQSINVWLGGTLHQHLDGHRQTVPGEERTHSVQVKEGTLFHRLCGQSVVTVNTFHQNPLPCFDRRRSQRGRIRRDRPRGGASLPAGCPVPSRVLLRSPGGRSLLCHVLRIHTGLQG